jgi:hypothetical protein
LFGSRTTSNPPRTQEMIVFVLILFLYETAALCGRSASSRAMERHDAEVLHAAAAFFRRLLINRRTLLKSNCGAAKDQLRPL